MSNIKEFVHSEFAGYTLGTFIFILGLIQILTDTPDVMTSNHMGGFLMFAGVGIDYLTYSFHH